MSEQYVVPKQVDWYDEQTLAAIFEEIREEELRLVNAGMRSYADNLRRIDEERQAA